MASAPASAQRRLLDVQALDTRVEQIARARSGIEQRAQLRQTEQELSLATDRAVAARTEASDIAREQTRAEGDVEQVRNRIQRDQQLMDSGSVAAKELENLAHEIESLRKRQAGLEDIELEIMERLEDARRAAEGFESDIARLTALRDELAADVAAREAELDAEHAEARAERAVIAAEIPADLLALYDKVREASGGAGAAMLRHGACQGCRISLPATELTRLRGVAEDAVERCDNCRAILVRTAESGL